MEAAQATPILRDRTAAKLPKQSRYMNVEPPRHASRPRHTDSCLENRKHRARFDTVGDKNQEAQQGHTPTAAERPIE
jgi:hypothetical protein